MQYALKDSLLHVHFIVKVVSIPKYFDLLHILVLTMEERETSDSSFVLLMKPQDSVADVLQFLSNENLPNAEAVMSRRISGEEVTTLLNRRSFLHDMIKSFSTADDSVAQNGKDEKFVITSSQWARVWRQFTVDVGREVFRVDNVRYSSPDDAVTAVAKFIAAAIDASAATKRSPVASPSASSSVWWLMEYLVPWDMGTGSPAPATAESSMEHSSINDMARLVILLSQQSVLAFPYETLHKQYTERCHGELFLGDIPSDSSDPLKNAMIVDLQMERPGFLTLSIKKAFRVFSLVDSEPCTLFTVKMQMELQLFSNSDPVELRWKFDRHDQRQRQEGGRNCECLGATSGFHKPNCLLGTPGS